MGLLSEGHPLTFEETKALADHVRRHGVQQFIHLFQKTVNERKGDVLKWGDEVEYVLVKMDKKTKSCKLLLNAKSLLADLQVPEKRGDPDLSSLWRPEYASYMIEGTPGGPYGGDITEFNLVEDNMKKRRKEVQALLGPDEYIFSLTAYPRMGCEGFTIPLVTPDPQNSVSRSLFWPDEAIFDGHPRFKTLTRNIRERRKEKVAINVPVFQDQNTRDPHEELVQKFGQACQASLPGHIYMDAMGFGMGLSCLQLTFQACNLQEAVSLYDQLAPLCPIMLAFTASNPVLRGMLAATDCRWDIIAASVDCRTRPERGLEPLNSNDAKFGRIEKSRYGSISSYLSACSLKSNYNDIDLVQDPETYQTLKEAGIEDLMAKHIAHLFIRYITKQSFRMYVESKKNILGTQCRCLAKRSTRMTKKTLIILKIFNLPIGNFLKVKKLFKKLILILYLGKRCDSNLHPQTHLSAGESNSVRVNFKYLTLKMPQWFALWYS